MCVWKSLLSVGGWENKTELRRKKSCSRLKDAWTSLCSATKGMTLNGNSTSHFKYSFEMGNDTYSRFLRIAPCLYLFIFSPPKNLFLPKHGNSITFKNKYSGKKKKKKRELVSLELIGR